MVDVLVRYIALKDAGNYLVPTGMWKYCESEDILVICSDRSDDDAGAALLAVSALAMVESERDC